MSAHAWREVFRGADTPAVSGAQGADGGRYGARRYWSVPKSDHSAASVTHALLAGYAEVFRCAHSGAHKDRDAARLRCAENMRAAPEWARCLERIGTRCLSS